MPNWSRSSISTLVRDAGVLYGNAKGNPEVAAKLALYKVTETTLDEGLALVAAVTGATGDYGGEKVDESQATGRAQATTADAAQAFTDDREMTRTVYPRGSDEYEALGLAGSPPRARAAVLGAGKASYDTLQTRPALIDPIPGLTPEIVVERLAAVAAALSADATQAEEQGAVDVASDDRKTVVANLRTHASRVSKVARTALKDRPQLLETLGLLARS